MHISVIANPALKTELLAQSPRPGIEITWSGSPIFVPGASCYLDLLFENKPERISSLEALQPAMVVVNEVSAGIAELPGSFVSINGWPGFLARTVVEASATNKESRTLTEQLFSHFGKQVVWVPPQPGFVTARVVSMVINEAYHALGEGVSTKGEIDTAMKLGTNYPYGPFEWADRIGLIRICSLLEKLAGDKPDYKPAPLLKKESLLK